MVHGTYIITQHREDVINRPARLHGLDPRNPARSRTPNPAVSDYLGHGFVLGVLGLKRSRKPIGPKCLGKKTKVLTKGIAALDARKNKTSVGNGQTDKTHRVFALSTGTVVPICESASLCSYISYHTNL
jgi:hypothetical protein